RSHAGSSLIIAGPHQPPAVHALAHAMNEKLRNTGKTVRFTAPVEAHFAGREGTLRDLVDDLGHGRVTTLLILSANPVYTAPADLNFENALQGATSHPGSSQTLCIHMGLYDDETGVLSQWHLPESHYLEAWSDARAFDGTASL